MNKHWRTLSKVGLVVVWLGFLLFGPETGYCLAMAVISGTTATAGGHGILAAQRVVDMSDTIHLLDPNEAPLTAVTMKLNTAHCINPKFSWLLDDYLPPSTTLAGTGTYSATTTSGVIVATGTGAYFRAGDVLKSLQTGETMYVISVSTDTLTVVRSVGDVAAGDLTGGGVLLIIGNANHEGSTGRAVKSTQRTEVYNYCQIFRWPWGATETLIASETYGGDTMDYEARKAGIEYRIQIERAFLFGERAEYTAGELGNSNKAIRLTGGIISQITTNVTTPTNGTLTADVLETFLRTGMRYGPARKMLFASRPIVSYLTLLARSSLRTIPEDTSFPLALTEYVSPHGKLYIVTHNLLEGTGANNNAYEGWALLLDLDSIFYRYLQGRDTKIHRNIQANDADERTDEYRGECGLMLIQEKNHAIFNGIDGYA